VDASERRERQLETMRWELEQRAERAEAKAREQLLRVSARAHDEVCVVHEPMLSTLFEVKCCPPSCHRCHLTSGPLTTLYSNRR